MATKKKVKVESQEPVVIRGSHSTRTEYPDGRVEFETHWDELKRDVEQALAEYELTKKDKPAKAVKKVKKAVEEVIDKVAEKKPAKTVKAKKTAEEKPAKIAKKKK